MDTGANCASSPGETLRAEDEICEAQDATPTGRDDTQEGTNDTSRIDPGPNGSSSESSDAGDALLVHEEESHIEKSAYTRGKDSSNATIKETPTYLEILIHLFAVAATLTVILINIVELFWLDLESSTSTTRARRRFHVSQNAQLKYLQLAAKFHETSMMGSLSVIIIHHAQRVILRKGVPFGLLDVPYIIGAGGGVSVLGQKRFWRAAFSSRSHVFFGISLMLCAILSQLVGPSSAIAMIPSLAWWPAGRSLKMYVGGEDRPVGITPWLDLHSRNDWTIAKDAWCFTNKSISTPDCPVGGYAEVDEWVNGFYYIGRPGNLTMSEPFSNSQRTLLSHPFDSFTEARTPGRTVTTATTALDAAILGGYWNYRQSNPWSRIPLSRIPSFQSTAKSSAFQPLVYTECYSTLYDPNTTSVADLQVPNANVPWLNGKTASSDAYIPRNDTILEDLFSGKTRFEWRIMENYSAVSVHVLPVQLVRGVWVQGSLVVTCAVDARWIPARISMEPKDSVTAKSNISDLYVFEENSPKEGSSQQNNNLAVEFGISPNAVSLPQEFLTSLDISISKNGSNTTRMLSFLESFVSTTEFGIQQFESAWTRLTEDETYNYSINQFLSIWMGATIADALARYTYMLWYVYLDVTSRSDKTPFYVDLYLFNYSAKVLNETQVFGNSSKEDTFWVELDEARYGYGYGFRSDDTGTSVKFAIAILALYILVVLSHMAVVLIWRHQGSYRRSSLWEDFLGLVTLAIISDSPEYFNKTENLRNPDRHKLQVQIREGERPTFTFEEEHKRLATGSAWLSISQALTSPRARPQTSGRLGA